MGSTVERRGRQLATQHLTRGRVDWQTWNCLLAAVTGAVDSLQLRHLGLSDIGELLGGLRFVVAASDGINGSCLRCITRLAKSIVTPRVHMVVFLAYEQAVVQA